MRTERLETCIKACLDCAVECDHCATACLNEKEIAMLVRCIQLNRECAQACYAAGQLMAIEGEHAGDFCQTCAQLCDDCAEECEKHGNQGMEHCRKCAEICRMCADECRAMTGINA